MSGGGEFRAPGQLPDAPVFRPTAKEFADPSKYVFILPPSAPTYDPVSARHLFCCLNRSKGESLTAFFMPGT
jgi:hypothetical protein